jgi:hypothetical protein
MISSDILELTKVIGSILRSFRELSKPSTPPAAAGMSRGEFGRK